MGNKVEMTQFDFLFVDRLGSGQDQKSHIPKEKYDNVPARRPGNEEDIARAVIHLVVNQYINGHNELVDGGYSLIEGY